MISSRISFYAIRKLAVMTLAIFSLFSCGVLRNRQNPHYFAGKPTAENYQPQGTIEEVRYPCSAPGPRQRRMVVYLPKDYYQSGKRYPTLYLLHGAKGHETAWIKRGKLLQITDSLFAHNLATQTLIVLPNTNEYDDDIDMEYSRWKIASEALFEINGNVESAFVQDVVKFVDTHFRTLPDREHRAIAGVSTGGLQAAYLSANFPDCFAHIALFSPVPFAFFKNGPNRDFFRDLDKKTDFLFEHYPPISYYIMIGKGDVLYPSSKCRHRKLEKKNHPHYFITYKGGHEWYNWNAFYTFFLSSIFK